MTFITAGSAVVEIGCGIDTLARTDHLTAGAREYTLVCNTDLADGTLVIASTTIIALSRGIYAYT
jgi:hypothetical protein